MFDSGGRGVIKSRSRQLFLFVLGCIASASVSVVDAIFGGLGLTAVGRIFCWWIVASASMELDGRQGGTFFFVVLCAVL